MKLVLSTFLTCIVFIATAQKCPTITLKGPAGFTVAESDDLIFTAEVIPANNNATYNWVISAGTITPDKELKQ
jgi:hypothetical protein